MSRKKHSSGLKTKIVLEALQERISIQELGKKYDIHPNQISSWKTQFLKGTLGIFEKGVKVEDDSKQKEDQAQLLPTAKAKELQRIFQFRSVKGLSHRIYYSLM